VTEQRYIFGENADHAELARLQLLESWADPITIQNLRPTGLTAGWRCLEVGAGAGSIARWLSSEVGRSGSVVAADLNPRFLGDVPANVEVRTHDILQDVDVDEFDLAHSRCVLIHLPDPHIALANMVRALKPGGWLAVDEADWGLFSLAGHPDAAWATEFVHDLFARHADAGVRYPYFGRRLGGALAEHGLGDVRSQGAAAVACPGDGSADVYRMTFDALRGLNRSVGATETDLDRLAAVVASAGVTITGVTLITARGRKH
jgi:ubiquinone/menaquinone biosynthesis C-methylase UbiE